MSRTKLFARPIYWLLILALVLSLALAAVPVGSKVSAAPSEVWVDDDAPAGWYADPTHFDKIKDALNAVAAPGTVHVASGTYEENITLKDKVQVLGAGADTTTINGGGTDSVVKASGGVGASTKLDGFTITNGNADYGGGMRITSVSSLVISNCKFVGNSAVMEGGGMYNYESSPKVTDCDFSNNSAIYGGGGMANRYDSSPAVTDCFFSGNSADEGGGMANRYDSSPAVTDCVFSGNSADKGGGMYNDESSPKVTDCFFSGNSANGAGGMYNFRSSPSVTGCVFDDNSATSTIYGHGGGMFNCWSSSPTVTNCNFSNNLAEWTGGGMYNYMECSPTVTNCVFHANSAIREGGGMYNGYQCSPTVTNCIVTSNTAGASYYGGGLYGGGDAIDYSDVWNNSPKNYGGSCSQGLHDISVNPMFVNPSAQDFHLMSDSPCIDAGTNDGAPAEDKDGEPRPIDGDWDGTATTDMGAYEYIPVLPVEFSATPTMGPTPLEVQFTDETPGDFSSWSWDFGDGGTSSEQNPTHTYDRTGPFTVSLSISSLSGRGTETKVDYIWPYTQGVGGEAYPVSRLAILAPWFALAALLLGATGWLVLRRRRA